MKRILSILLTLVTLLTMCMSVSVSASSDDGETVLTYFDGVMYSDASNSSTLSEDEWQTYDSTSSNRNFYPVYKDSEVRKQLIIKYKSSYYGNGVKWTTDSDDNDYYIFNYSYVFSNYRTDFTEHMTADASVASFSYDICIPDESSDKTRTTELQFVSGGSTTDNRSYLYIDYDGSGFSVSTTDITKISSVSAKYTPGDWVNVEVRACRNSDGEMIVGVYVEGKQIFYGKSASSLSYTDGLGVYTQSFTTEKGTDENSAKITYDTYYDDIKYSIKNNSYMPTNNINIINVDFSDSALETQATSLSAANTTVVNTLSTRTLQESTNSADNFEGTTNYKSVARSDEDSDPALSVTTTADGTTSQFLQLVLTARASLAGFVNTDKETVIKASYDIYIPEGTEKAKREHRFNIAGKNNNSYAKSDVTIISEIVNKTLTFYTKKTDTNNASEVAASKRSESITLDTNKWHTIEYLLKITYDSTNTVYNVKIYGMYNGNCLYTSEYNIDGNVFCLASTQGLYMYGTGGAYKGYETRYDNILMTHYYNWLDDAAYNYNAWEKSYIYPISLTYDETSGATAAINIDDVESKYNNPLLFVAAYDNDGKFLGIIAKSNANDLTNGILNIASSDTFAAGNTLKAFLFDALNTAVPMAEHAEYVIPSAE